MARGVHRLDGNVANLERLPVLWCRGDAFAVLATNDGELVGAQLRQLERHVSQVFLQRGDNIRLEYMYQLLVAAGVVPVAVIICWHQISISIHVICRGKTYW